MSLLVVGLLAVAGWFALMLVLVAICNAAKQADEASEFVGVLGSVPDEPEEVADASSVEGTLLSF